MKVLTKAETVETCARAIIARHNPVTDNWRDYPKKVDLAEDIVAALVALKLIPLVEMSEDDKRLL
jgi:hypothetical protein